MLTSVVTESKNKKLPKPTKLCLKCGRARELTEYYNNKDWDEQLGKDIWCKDCVSKLKNKDEVKEYFWENHREWNEKIWESAKNKADKLVNTNPTYLKSSDDRKALILERIICQQVPSCMALYYKYVDNNKNSDVNSYQEAKEKGMILNEEEDPNLKVYSQFFNGYFKPNELKYLETYYKTLENDFDLDTENIRDYARKISKASLQADKAQDDYAAGRCDFSVVKDALALYDLLSKSANFAACKRKPNEQSGLSSWSELTYKLETSGHPCTRKIEWEKDDVDKTIDEFKYIVESLGLDTI